MCIQGYHKNDTNLCGDVLGFQPSGILLHFISSISYQSYVACINFLLWLFPLIYSSHFRQKYLSCFKILGIIAIFHTSIHFQCYIYICLCLKNRLDALRMLLWTFILYSSVARVPLESLIFFPNSYHHRNKFWVRPITSEDKDFICNICDCKGATSKNLRRHKDTASESISQPCQDCDYVKKTVDKDFFSLKIRYSYNQCDYTKK